MEKNIDKIKKKLKKYNQEHLLGFYNNLNSSEKKFLLKQLNNTDFKGIYSLFNSFGTFNSVACYEISIFANIYCYKCYCSFNIFT